MSDKKDRKLQELFIEDLGQVTGGTQESTVSVGEDDPEDTTVSVGGEDDPPPPPTTVSIMGEDLPTAVRIRPPGGRGR